MRSTTTKHQDESIKFFLNQEKKKQKKNEVLGIISSIVHLPASIISWAKRNR
jgi:hypothetical protein